MGDQSPDEALRKDANSFDCIQLKIYMRKQQWLIFIEHLIYTCYGFFFFFCYGFFMVVLYRIKDAQLGSVLKTHCFPCGSEVKNLPAMQGHRRLGSDPWSGRSPGGGNGSHSSTLAWEIPQTEEPDGHS